MLFIPESHAFFYGVSCWVFWSPVIQTHFSSQHGSEHGYHDDQPADFSRCLWPIFQRNPDFFPLLVGNKQHESYIKIIMSPINPHKMAIENSGDLDTNGMEHGHR